MKYGLCIVLGSSLFLSACSTGTLPCNDDDMKEITLEIIVDGLRSAKWATESEESNRLGNYSISGIKTLSHDENIDSYNCGATFSYQFDDQIKQKEFTYELSYLEDSGETEVGVYGFDTIKSMVFLSVARGGTKR